MGGFGHQTLEHLLVVPVAEKLLNAARPLEHGLRRRFAERASQLESVAQPLGGDAQRMHGSDVSLMMGAPVGILPLDPGGFTARAYGLACAIGSRGCAELHQHAAQAIRQPVAFLDEQRPARADAFLETALLEVGGHELPDRAPARAARRPGPRGDRDQRHIAVSPGAEGAPHAAQGLAQPIHPLRTRSRRQGGEHLL